MEGYGTSIFFDPDDSAENNAHKLYKLHESGIDLEPKGDYLKNFQRKNLTMQLAAVLDKIS
jgi:hypothetical protein